MIAPRNMITADDIKAVGTFLELGAPLSGYLAGNPHGGAAVQRLEEVWCTKFNRRHAICCNSATSGLLAACVAMGVGDRTVVGVPALSMSATAAVPKFLGSGLSFFDVDEHGGICFAELGNDYNRRSGGVDVTIATTLWGHPIDPQWGNSEVLILDNAQGIMSCYDGPFFWSENLPHISVTSFNVHKQINAGEMGIISCDDDVLDNNMRNFINHGEMSSDSVGLNLRPTEISAVLALSQMSRVDETIENLRTLFRRLVDNTPSTFHPILPREGTKSGCYCYTFRTGADYTHTRKMVEFLSANGVPCSQMYRPLYRLPAFNHGGPCDMAEAISNDTIVFELCAWRYEDDITYVAQMLQGAAKL